jgi:hypothetical protein
VLLPLLSRMLSLAWNWLLLLQLLMTHDWVSHLPTCRSSGTKQGTVYQHELCDSRSAPDAIHRLWYDSQPRQQTQPPNGWPLSLAPPEEVTSPHRRWPLWALAHIKGAAKVWACFVLDQAYDRGLIAQAQGRLLLVKQALQGRVENVNQQSASGDNTLPSSGRTRSNI